MAELVFPVYYVTAEAVSIYAMPKASAFKINSCIFAWKKQSFYLAMAVYTPGAPKYRTTIIAIAAGKK
jgi:hypothetical protein